MRRLAITLSGLLLSLTVAAARPGAVLAAPPPPCPVGEIFVFCDTQCMGWPGSMEEWCLAFIGSPVDCVVTDAWCDLLWHNLDCLGQPGGPAYRTFCHYERWN